MYCERGSGLSAPMGTIEAASGLPWGPMDIPAGLWRSMQTWSGLERYNFLRTWATQKGLNPGDAMLRAWARYTAEVDTETGDPREDIDPYSLSNIEIVRRLSMRRSNPRALTWDELPGDLQTRLLIDPRVRGALRRLFRMWGRRYPGAPTVDTNPPADETDGRRRRRRRGGREVVVPPVTTPAAPRAPRVIYARSDLYRRLRRRRGLNGSRRGERQRERMELREEARRRALENLTPEQRERREERKVEAQSEAATESFFEEYGLIVAALGLGLLAYTFLKK